MGLKRPLEPLGVVSAICEPAIQEELDAYVSGRHRRSRPDPQLIEPVLPVSHELEKGGRAVEGVIDGVVMRDALRK